MNFQTTYPKITVVTPNFNQVGFIEKTIQSVLNQKFPNLEYIIIDGGSTDGSVEIIKKYEKQLSYWVSEKDNGMYDAINKGFLKSSGDIMCWINSDDVLWEGSLDYIASIFKSHPKINWLQGLPSVIDKNGTLVFQRKHIYSKFYFYLFLHKKTFSFIQQESTFWTRDLWERAGSKLSLAYTLASDFDLWMQFFKYENLYCSNRQLAAFRKHENQLSSNQKLYLEEVNSSIKKNIKELRVLDRFLINLVLFINNYRNTFTKKIVYKLQSLLIKKPYKV